IYRAGLHTGVATRTSVDLLFSGVVAQQRLTVVQSWTSSIDAPSDFFSAVTHIHHDLSWRKFFASDVGRTLRGTAAAFRAGIRIENIDPAQVIDILGAKAAYLRWRFGRSLGWNAEHHIDFIGHLRHISH